MPELSGPSGDGGIGNTPLKTPSGDGPSGPGGPGGPDNNSPPATTNTPVWTYTKVRHDSKPEKVFGPYPKGSEGDACKGYGWQ